MDTYETVHAEPHGLVESPIYRVNFWHRQSLEQAWLLDAWTLNNVEDITEALRWVEEHAQGRRFELFVESEEESETSFESPRTAALVRLLGDNPNKGELQELGYFQKI